MFICGGVDDKGSSTQDFYFFNHTIFSLTKSVEVGLNICDKFTGGQMCQYVINRLEAKVHFTSDSFIHEIEYGAKNGRACFKTRTAMIGM